MRFRSSSGYVLLGITVSALNFEPDIFLVDVLFVEVLILFIASVNAWGNVSGWEVYEVHCETSF